MLGGLFSRHHNKQQQAGPPKVIEPPLIPSQEKRQEKERRWIESISRGSRAAPSSYDAQLPAPVEFIKSRDDNQNTTLLSPGSTGGRLLDRWNSSAHRRGSSAHSHSLSSSTSNAQDTSRSLRSTRSSSALASRFASSLGGGGPSKNNSNSSVNSNRNRQESSSSSSSNTAIAHSPFYTQAGGNNEAASSFLHVPQSSSSLIPPPSFTSTNSSSSFSRHLPFSSREDDSATQTTSPSRLGGSTLVQHSRSNNLIQATFTTRPISALKDDNSKTLASRLRELEHANQVGLLNDEEYRVLRKNLFEKRVRKQDVPPNLMQQPLPPPSLASIYSPSAPYQLSPVKDGSNVQRTGTLLGLTRLNMAEGNTKGES
jgi:hypothetical protein